MFGGDHASAKHDAMNELQTMDKRIQTFNHPDMAANVLKCIYALDAPNGDKLTPEFLEGRVVGFLLFGETQRTLDFLPQLCQFQESHKGDFVVVGMSRRIAEVP